MKTTWANKTLSFSEIQTLRDVLAQLDQKAAILQVELCDSAKQEPNLQKRIEKELQDKSSSYCIGITSNKTDSSIDNVAVTVKRFKDKDIHEFEDVDVPQTPDAFFNKLPKEVLLSTSSFRLVDPYIYEIKTVRDAEKRMEFLRILEEKYYETNIPRKPIKIEVYGRWKREFDQKQIQNLIAQSKKLIGMRKDSRIDFIAFSKYSKPEFRKKIHARYFVAGKFCWSFEETSEDRDENITQWWRFIPSKKRKNIDNEYRLDSQVFRKVAHFTKNQILLS